MPKELDPPPVASADDESMELLRAWVARSGQHVSLRIDAWDDPAAWGIFLVDLARHIARGYAESTGDDPREVLARLREGFDAEWSSPSDATTRTVVE